MTYEIVPGMSGFGSFGGAGDLLGESCLCGPAGSCTNAKLQGPAMAQLRAAMAAAGLSPSSGVWKQAEANQMNALATAGGQPTSSKFLVDGGPCRALKAKLAAPPPPTGGGTTTTGGVTCASLLSQAPPIPPGTPVDAVIAVLQQLAPAGFDVRACVANSTPATTIPQPGKDILPPGTAGGSVSTVTGGGDTSGLSPLIILGLGLVAVMGVGGIAFVALSPKMRKNGRRKKRRGSLRRNGGPVAGDAYRFQPITGEEHPLRGDGDAWVSAPLTTYDVERRGWRRYGETRIGRHMATVWQPIAMGRAVHGVYVAQKDRG